MTDSVPEAVPFKDSPKFDPPTPPRQAVIAWRAMYGIGGVLLVSILVSFLSSVALTARINEAAGSDFASVLDYFGARDSCFSVIFAVAFFIFATKLHDGGRIRIASIVISILGAIGGAVGMLGALGIYVTVQELAAANGVTDLVPGWFLPVLLAISFAQLVLCVTATVMLFSKHTKAWEAQMG